MAIYLSATDTAFLLRGCRVEDYPELTFILIVAPVALVALVLAIVPSLPRARSRPARLFLTSASLFLIIIGAIVTIDVLVEPGGGTCRSSSAA